MIVLVSNRFLIVKRGSTDNFQLFPFQRVRSIISPMESGHIFEESEMVTAVKFAGSFWISAAADHFLSVINICA